MKYVSEKYEQQLHDLAETLCTPERLAKLGELSIYEQEQQAVQDQLELPHAE